MDLPFPEEESSLSLGSLPSGKLTKTMIQSSAKEFAAAIVDGGEQDPLKQYIVAKAGVEFLNEVSKGLKSAAEEELMKYNKSQATIHGVGLSIASSATIYSYDHDEVWCDLDEKVKELTQMKKDREELMKQAIKFSGVFDKDGVEVQQAKYKSGGGEVMRVAIPKS